MKLLWIGVLVVAFLVTSGLPAYSQQDVPSDLSITLERRGCPLGWCPAYALTITANGGVKFTPEGAFAQRGDGPMPPLPLTDRLTKDEVRNLYTEFHRIKFFSFRSRYHPTGKNNTGPSCPEYSTDSPSAIVTILVKGRRKTVNHYLGCKGTSVLDQLESLEDEIDETSNAKRWVSKFAWDAGSVVDLLLSANEIDNLGSDHQIKVKTVAADPENDVLTYQYTVSGGRIIGNGADVIWDLTGAPVGTYTITAGVDDGCGICGKTMTKTVTIR